MRQEIKQIRGVTAVKGRLWGYYYDPGVKANYTLMVPEAFSLGDNNIAVGKGIAGVGPTWPRAVPWSFEAHDYKIITLWVKGS